jgi:hypothetical protein
MKKLRKSIKYLLPALAVVLILGLILSRVYQPEPSLNPEGTIEARAASEYIGRVMEVCDYVASTDFREDIGGQPSFLNLGNPYPDQYLTVVIWGRNLGKWHESPYMIYSNRSICVTGRIEEYQGRPQIIVSSPEQISIPS